MERCIDGEIYIFIKATSTNSNLYAIWQIPQIIFLLKPINKEVACPRLSVFRSQVNLQIDSASNDSSIVETRHGASGCERLAGWRKKKVLGERGEEGGRKEGRV